MIIEHILKNEKLVPKDFEDLCLKMSKMDKKDKKKITVRTLQRDLKALIDKKVIKPEGATHKMVYVLF